MYIEKLQKICTIVVIDILQEGNVVAKVMKKRAYHKQDMDKLNRIALLIGGIAAAIILLLMIGSSLIK